MIMQLVQMPFLLDDQKSFQIICLSDDEVDDEVVWKIMVSDLDDDEDDEELSFVVTHQCEGLELDDFHQYQ